MSYTMDVESFINEVQKYPEIWNTNSEENKMKCKKQAAWSDIARVFIDDFDDMPEVEKFDVHKKLHAKWRNIRDSFVRYQKRKDKKYYMYAKYLDFLKTIYKHPSDDCEHYWSDLEASRKLERSEENDHWQSDDEVPLNPENYQNRKRIKEEPQVEIEYVDTPINPDPTSSYPIEDEDRSFFDSLLPAIRKFNMDQKLEFRTEVLCLVKKIRSSGKKRRKLDSEAGDFDC